MRHPNHSQLISMIESGKTVSEIRQVLKCGRTTVYNWMRRLGVEPPSVPRPRGWKKRDWHSIQLAYDRGLSKEECLKQFSISPELWTRAHNEGRLLVRTDDVSTLNSDLTGTQFCDWTVLKRVEGPKQADGSRYWLCQCVCGTKVVKTTAQVKFDSKSCGCRKMRRGNDSPRWKGYGEISLSYWGSIIRASKSRSKDIPFEVSIEDAWDIFLKQDRKCAISGIPLMFASQQRRRDMTASLDRIDSDRGYTKDNVQWVHKDVNVMKLDHSSAEFLKWIDIIYHHNQNLKK